MRNGADIYDLTVARTPLKIGGTVSEQPITINGTLPAPLVRLKQGREAILRVTNTLPEATSIHWHGLILPYQMDGVPGVSFPGIMPGETFEYRFPVEQHGTYWYHSHSGLQEQLVARMVKKQVCILLTILIGELPNIAGLPCLILKIFLSRPVIGKSLNHG